MKKWVKHKINDFCYVTDFVANGSFASLRENVTYINKPDYAVLVRLTDFSKKWSKDFVYVSKPSYDFLKKSFLKPGDLIMSNVGDPGIVFLVPDLKKPMTLGPNSILIRPNEKNSSSKFLFLYFLSEKGKKQIDDISTGAAQKKFNKTSFRELDIPLPPLPEQLRIVALLDEAFASIAKAKANAEQNLKNAKELLSSVTEGFFNSVKSSDLVPMEDLTDAITDYVANGSFASLAANVKYNKDKDYAILIRLLDHSREFKGEFVYINKTAYDFLSKSKIYPNDIIISNVGARLGTVFRAPDLGMPMSLGPNSVLLRSEKFGDYLYCWLSSSSGQNAIKDIVSGAGQPKFNKTQFRKIKVPVPKDKKIREQISLIIGEVTFKTQSLEKIYLQKINDLYELKKSVLQKAFNGELKTA